MGRYHGPSCRLCRREGARLFLKGMRCQGAKCSFSKRDFPPGPKSWRRPKPSDYGIRLREKQKVKRYYGVLERQFKRIFARAERSRGNTAEALLQLLERRLDNVVYRLGFGASIKQARQIVSHGLVRLNGRRVTIPSITVRKGDTVSMRKGENMEKLATENMEASRQREMPTWLRLDEGELKGQVLDLPRVEEIPIEIQAQLIVELCSR